MGSYATKLKIGRKLEGVDTSTASDNQVSILLRYDEEDGAEDHVSVSIESDAMAVDDVFALLEFLDERGILTSSECKTWLHQSKASREEHGSTSEWAGQDLEQKVTMAKKGLTTRSGSNGSGKAAKQALVKVSQVESQLEELKDTLRGADTEADEDGGAEPTPSEDGPTPPNAL